MTVPDPEAVTAETSFIWRVTNADHKVNVELGTEASKLPTTQVMHLVAEQLIKLGTSLLQKRVRDDDDEDWDE